MSVTITLRHLSAFVSVARLGSFKEAADSLHLSQSALTMQVLGLEDMLGLRLFDRSHRQVSLTFAGSTLMPLAEAVVGRVDEFTAAAEDFRGLNSGIVRVATLPSVAARYLTPAARVLRQEHPGFRLRIVDAVASRVAELVRRGDVDFGISSSEMADAELRFDLLLTDHICAYMQDGFAPAPGRGTVALADLLSRPLILPAKSGIVRRLFDRAAAAHGGLPTPAYEAVYDATAMSLAREGLGVAILSESIQSAMNVTGLGQYRIVDPELRREVGFLQSRGQTLSKVSHALQLILKELVRAEA
ncbi:MAG: LysR family transcriptional regulator [Enterovirga sp.]|jgi:LysR family carnitine catabolism transcriptional activator|nr:LysR family transcriptional regulator [Enterovirga sp.]